jgi:hypothetical protein
MICCQFIFKQGIYDDEFHHLDAAIDTFARSLPGFDRVEKWHAPEHRIINAMYYFTDHQAVAELAGPARRWGRKCVFQSFDREPLIRGCPRARRRFTPGPGTSTARFHPTARAWRR